ncbi:MAG: Rpn family recombination-promoting nuclease/putative transposase, partial [Synergistaceae bacterium]|nr:Rpn family recombination-promoting nuclease/putative transposase [Synergistaceae bacterium]
MAKSGQKKQSEKQVESELSPRILPLNSDVIFKMVFGDKRNNNILRSFLAAALNIPEAELEEIEVI